MEIIEIVDIVEIVNNYLLLVGVLNVQRCKNIRNKYSTLD